MDHSNMPLQPADYAEPRCLLCGEPYGAETPVRPVPQQRIIEKMDEYMARRDYAGAEKHLLYWLQEAELGHDGRGRLMLLGELVGHYRKTGEKEKSLARGEEALALLKELDYEDSISAGTPSARRSGRWSCLKRRGRSMKKTRRPGRSFWAGSITTWRWSALRLAAMRRPTGFMTGPWSACSVCPAGRWSRPSPA